MSPRKTNWNALSHGKPTRLAQILVDTIALSIESPSSILRRVSKVVPMASSRIQFCGADRFVKLENAPKDLSGKGEMTVQKPVISCMLGHLATVQAAPLAEINSLSSR
jgi:hypothetical protein